MLYSIVNESIKKQLKIYTVFPNQNVHPFVLKLSFNELLKSTRVELILAKIPGRVSILYAKAIYTRSLFSSRDKGAEYLHIASSDGLVQGGHPVTV